MKHKTCLTLIKRDYYKTRSSILWLAIFLILIMFILLLFSIATGGLAGIMQNIYLSLGFISASFAFWEFKSASNIRCYLLIPATAIEKVIAKVVFYSLGWLFLFMACFIMASILAMLVLLVFHSPLFIPWISIFNVFQALRTCLPQVILIQATVMFAGCYFKRQVLLKLLCVYGLLILPIQAIISYEITTLAALNHYLFRFLEQYANSLASLGQVITILVLWSLTWLRIRETEAE